MTGVRKGVRGRGEPPLTSTTPAAFRWIALLLLPPIVVSVVRRLRADRAVVAVQARIAGDETPPAEVVLPVPEPAEISVPALPEWEMVADTDEVWTAPGGWVHDSIL